VTKIGDFMKEIRPPFSWKTLLFDFNSDKLEECDILKHREKLVKDLKKKYSDIVDFADALGKDLMHQYWSRCEYEMILYIENERVFVQPWIGRRDPIESRVDVTDYPSFNWPAFAKHMLKIKGYQDNTVKIDVYDQLKFRFDELIDFCWNYKHKYQRTKK
jgi:hypothetical protein